MDFVCFDAEDWGVPQWSDTNYNGDSWALGAQYWAEKAHSEGYKARFGILLDMVGGIGAMFHREAFSQQLLTRYGQQPRWRDIAACSRMPMAV